MQAKLGMPNSVVLSPIFLKSLTKNSLMPQRNLEGNRFHFSPFLGVGYLTSHALKLSDRLFHYCVVLRGPPETLIQNLVEIGQVGAEILACLVLPDQSSPIPKLAMP